MGRPELTHGAGQAEGERHVLLALAALMAALAAYEWPRIDRFGGGKGERLAFALFMIAAFALGAARVLGLPVPNPTAMIQTVFEPLNPLRY